MLLHRKKGLICFFRVPLYGRLNEKGAVDEETLHLEILALLSTHDYQINDVHELASKCVFYSRERMHVRQVHKAV